MDGAIPLAIELGDMTLSSATPISEILWFVAGLILLVLLTAAMLWWQRRSRPDPFE